jgi:hypothetical protein
LVYLREGGARGGEGGIRQRVGGAPERREAGGEDPTYPFQADREGQAEEGSQGRLPPAFFGIRIKLASVKSAEQ